MIAHEGAKREFYRASQQVAVAPRPRPPRRRTRARQRESLTIHGVQKRMTDIQARRDRVRALGALGKSLEEVRRALGDPVTVPGPGGRANAVASLTAIIYHERVK
jgi:hypothetical protein